LIDPHRIILKRHGTQARFAGIQIRGQRAQLSLKTRPA
jgi:hypothetical protein